MLVQTELLAPYRMPGGAVGARMFEPFLELMMNAVDLAATLIVLLALWEGRTARGVGRIGRWLGIRSGIAGGDIDRFLHEARRFAPEPGGKVRSSLRLPRP